jgi:hypothetical protein
VSVAHTLLAIERRDRVDLSNPPGVRQQLTPAAKLLRISEVAAGVVADIVTSSARTLLPASLTGAKRKSFVARRN